MVFNEGVGSLKFILNNYWLAAVATTDELPPAMFFDVDSDQFIVWSVQLLYSSTGLWRKRCYNAGYPAPIHPAFEQHGAPRAGCGVPRKVSVPS